MASYVSGNSTIVSGGEFREEATRVLNEIKAARRGRKFKLVQIGNKTFKEVEIFQDEVNNKEKEKAA